MYCIQCGVELSDSEKICPLCGTPVFHPDLKQPDGEKPFPAGTLPHETASRFGVLFVLTALFLLPLVIVLVCDWQINHAIVWSGYVGGALALSYVLFVLPFWFRRPILIIFLSADFLAAGLYLLYIDLQTGGHWFLSFAFPVTGGLMVLFVTAAALLSYVRRGKLFILSGVIAALGGFMVLIEFLLNRTFHLHERLIWSVYPLASCLVIALALLIIACSPPLREGLRRKFFL